jgi:hypothetical protein
MRTVVFRAPSGCANKIAPQFQPHRPLTSYLLGLRPMNAPPRGIFLIAPPIGAPFFMFGGIGLPPLRGPITGGAIGLRPALRQALGCLVFFLTAQEPPLRGPITGGAIGLRGPLLTGGAIGPRGPLPTGGAIGPIAGGAIFSGGTRAIRISYTHGLSYHLLHCLRPYNAIWGQTMIHLPLHDRFLCNFSKNTIAC